MDLQPKRAHLWHYNLMPGIVVGSYLASWASDGVVRNALALVLIAVAIKLVT